MAAIMLDPSLLFSDEGQALLEDGEARDRMVISERFGIWLEDRSGIDAASFVAEDDRETFDERLATLRDMLAGVPPFSYGQVEADLPDAAECFACKLAIGPPLFAVLHSYSHPLWRPYWGVGVQSRRQDLQEI
jgi:hypothetical protein